jgi:hypothetical protein
MSAHYRRYTVEYKLAGRVYRETVHVEDEGHACRLVALRTGGTGCRVVGRCL